VQLSIYGFSSITIRTVEFKGTHLLTLPLKYFYVLIFMLFHSVHILLRLKTKLSHSRRLAADCNIESDITYISIIKHVLKSSTVEIKLEWNYAKFEKPIQVYGSETLGNKQNKLKKKYKCKNFICLENRWIFWNQRSITYALQELKVAPAPNYLVLVENVWNPWCSNSKKGKWFVRQNTRAQQREWNKLHRKRIRKNEVWRKRKKN
jgi:hypothetical protein